MILIFPCSRFYIKLGKTDEKLILGPAVLHVTSVKIVF